MKDIRIGINMQEYYDDLLLLRKSIEVQIKELAKDPSICTHKETEKAETSDNKTLIICSNCQKLIEGDVDLRPY